MDEYDERLVRWFDYELYPFICKEHYFAWKMARQKEMGQINQYWAGYFDAIDTVNRVIEEGINGIRDSVDKELRQDALDQDSRQE